MVLREGDTINLTSEMTDYDSIGDLSLEDAEFMPILILKNAFSFANNFDPQISRFLTMEAVRYDVSPEHENGFKTTELGFRPCTKEDFKGVEDQLETLSQGVPFTVFCPEDSS